LLGQNIVSKSPTSPQHCEIGRAKQIYISNNERRVCGEVKLGGKL